MNPLSPKQILRNLENGFFMTHQEQTEAAEYIRQLQQSNQALTALRQALAQSKQDWSLLKATQESLREHMAKVKKLEAQLAQLEQEPVAKHICNLWINPETSFYEVDRCTHPINEVFPVYAAPILVAVEKRVTR